MPSRNQSGVSIQIPVMSVVPRRVRRSMLRMTFFGLLIWLVILLAWFEYRIAL
jgi:hypothetical protein